MMDLKRNTVIDVQLVQVSENVYAAVKRMMSHKLNLGLHIESFSAKCNCHFG